MEQIFDNNTTKIFENRHTLTGRVRHDHMIDKSVFFYWKDEERHKSRPHRRWRQRSFSLFVVFRIPELCRGGSRIVCNQCWIRAVLRGYLNLNTFLSPCWRPRKANGHMFTVDSPTFFMCPLGFGAGRSNDKMPPMPPNQQLGGHETPWSLYFVHSRKYEDLKRTLSMTRVTHRP